MTRRWIDLSHPIAPTMPVLPNYPPVEVAVLDATDLQISGGPRRLNSSRIAIGLHTGTHMDAPFHFLGDGKTLEQIPLAQCVGIAVVVRLPGHGRLAPITSVDLAPYRDAIAAAGKVVFDTGWHLRWGDTGFFTEHPELTGDAAEALLAWGAHLIGVDFPSVDRDPYPAHVALLGGGAVIVENLTNLEAIRTERFHLTALPLPLVGRDGSPVRAVGEEL